MDTNRREFLKKSAVGAAAFSIPLLPHSSAIPSTASDDAAKYRWDILHISSFSPVTIDEGGFASALANDGTKITVTGNGTFQPGESEEVTGGGAWTTFASDGTTQTGSGTYKVTQLVRFELAPGFQTAGVVDQIPGATGDLSDQRAGLLFVKIAYSDGTRGVLVVSCHLNGGPDFTVRPAAPSSVFEGITASKGFTDYWSRLTPVAGVDGNRTAFHVITED